MQAFPFTPTSITFMPRAHTAGIDSLDDSSAEEVTEFLSVRPLHTAYISGLIRDNGLVSRQNRGTFYGYRNAIGNLEGVALIGHAILMEAMTDAALKAFAEIARHCSNAHIIMCEEERLDRFWNYYASGGKQMRRACREVLFELRWPSDSVTQSTRLRLATSADLQLLIPIHAEMALAESGVNPLESDLEGFTKRYAERIARGRTWVLTEGSKLCFKAEVVAETPASTYIEGVWVNPDVRRQGFGRNCMSQLARMLLWRTKSLCLFVNDDNEEAQAFYRQCGYHPRSVYDTIFVQ